MGRRGPPPMPTPLKVAAGTRSHKAANRYEPQPTATIPPCPDWLPERAKAEWQQITPELHRLGLLTIIDGAALSGYCLAVAELETATATLEVAGRVCVWPIFDKQGVKLGERLKAHPAVAMQRDAMAKVKAFISEFGLSPASRTRVHGKGDGKGEQDGRSKRFFPTVG